MLEGLVRDVSGSGKLPVWTMNAETGSPAAEVSLVVYTTHSRFPGHVRSMPRQLSVCMHAAPTSAVEHDGPQPLRPRLLDHVLDVHIVRAARRRAGEKGRTNRQKKVGVSAC